MTKLIRTTAILGAIWSVLITLALCLFGILMGMTDRFNGPHTLVFLAIGLTEFALLFALLQAYKLRPAAGSLLLAWFAMAALLTRPSGVADWFDCLLLLLVCLAPVTVTMILSFINQYSRSPKA